jgi:hypothetical protein
MEHFWEDIVGWGGEEVLDNFKRAIDLFPTGSQFVEVGSHSGRSATMMGVEIENSDKDFYLCCIDPNFQKCFDDNIEPVKEHITTISEKSPKAAKRFAYESVDFVWLDGDHGMAGVTRDLEGWFPKLKVGGVIAGHDYIKDDPFDVWVAVYHFIRKWGEKLDLRDYEGTPVRHNASDESISGKTASTYGCFWLQRGK